MTNEKDMLIEAYRIQVERWNKRRDIEWRVALTFWSAIVIITFGIAGKIQPSACVMVPIYAVLFVLYWHWIRCLWIRNAEDKKWMYKYQKKINKKLFICDVLEKGRFPKKPITWCNNYLKVFMDWSVRSQLVFTLFLLAGSGLILHHMPKSDRTLLSVTEKILDKLAELIEQNIR